MASRLELIHAPLDGVSNVVPIGQLRLSRIAGTTASATGDLTPFSALYHDRAASHLSGKYTLILRNVALIMGQARWPHRCKDDGHSGGQMGLIETARNVVCQAHDALRSYAVGGAPSRA